MDIQCVFTMVAAHGGFEVKMDIVIADLVVRVDY